MSEQDVRGLKTRAVPAEHQRGRTRAGRAAMQIHATSRDEIVSMKFKPLDMLNEKQLGQRFGVSRTPVREALLRLADEGLVEIYPQSGTFVSRIPRRALYEAILNTKLDKPNFRRKIMKMNLLSPCNEKQQGVPHRAASLYRFDAEAYKHLSESGFAFEI